MEKEIYKMIYKINKKAANNLTILGEEFVKNNKNKGKLSINNKKQFLKNSITIDNIKQSKLKIKIILNTYNYNKCALFKNCDSLLQVLIEDEVKNYEYLEINENKTCGNEERKKYYSFFSNNKESFLILTQKIILMKNPTYQKKLKKKLIILQFLI